MGTKYTAEIAVDGKVEQKQFDVVPSPSHFGSAPRYKSDALGMTVRDMTFEVRRYMQRSPQDPGVVISKIEPGGRASVAGLKPYEIITHVNDQPANNVSDFQRLCKGSEELRLSVKRMTRGRIVKIKVPATDPGATGASSKPAAG